MKTFYRMMVLAFAVLVISQPASFAQTTYYFSTTGVDSNNGTTISTPKKSIDTAITLMKNGNTIKFKRGDKWYIPFKTMDLTNKDNFILDAYGSGAKPVIASMLYYDSTQFSAVAGYSNVFKTTDAANVRDFRVFVNGVSRIALRDKLGNASSLSYLDSTDEFRFDTANKTLYLKMPSPARPHNVEVVGGTSSATTGTQTLKLQGCENVTIRNIEFRGGQKYACVYVHAPCYNITFDSCIISRTSYVAGGMNVINEVRNMDVVRKISIINCILDKGWTQAENNIKVGMTLGGDGIAFMHAVDSGLIKDCFLTNWGHSAIQLSAVKDSFGIFGVKHNKIEHNDVGSGNSAYMHAFDISGYKNLATLNIIKRNYFHDYNSACNLSGNNNFIFSNIFARVTVSPIVAHSHQPHGGQLFPWTLSGKRIDGRDNWVINNTFYKSEAYALNIGQSSGDTSTVKGNKIINNIMMNFGEDTTYTLDPPASPTARAVNVALKISMWKPNVGHHDGVPPGDLVIRNNNFYVKDSASTKRVAMYGSNYYNATSLNLCPEGSSRVTGNRWFNPVFDSWWGLTAASPVELREGGAVYDITNWGLPAGEFVDYYGEEWDSEKPSIGAIQYFD